MTDIFNDTSVLSVKLLALVTVPTYDDSPRVTASHIACSLALEHWHAARYLLQEGLLPSAAVVHRAQFEAALRSIWLLYAAPDATLAKIGADLSQASEQAAKNMPSTHDMLEHLAVHGPKPPCHALTRFKENSWKALNSYAHAGIHPMQRHQQGYPRALIESVMRNANGLAVLTCMQVAILSGQIALQSNVLAVAAAHPACMPPPL